jgi:hypothetical protein
MVAVPGVRIDAVLAEDAIGVTARATLLATGETVGVRHVHERLAGDESARLLFAQEVRRVATIDHPLLLRVRASDARAAVPWMRTDALDGETLEDALAAGAWPLARVKALLQGVLGAFAHLERRKQVHAAAVPPRFVRAGDSWRLVTLRDVRAEDEAPRLKGRPFPCPRWAPPEVGEERASSPKARALHAWFVGALWFALRTGKSPLEAPVPTAHAKTEEGRVLARFLDPEPMRRPHGADACLALVASVPDA